MQALKRENPNFHRFVVSSNAEGRGGGGRGKDFSLSVLWGIRRDFCYVRQGVEQLSYREEIKQDHQPAYSLHSRPSKLGLTTQVKLQPLKTAKQDWERRLLVGL